MFTPALFTVAKTWEQSEYPSTDDWIKKVWYIYTTEYYSAIKKPKIMLFAATWIQLESLILSDVSQKEKDKYYIISLTWNLKYDTDEPTYKTEMDSQTWRADLWLPRGSGEGMG
uniref:DUF1725 domain-containing protein n=1 Tax=Sus scrofa TaxID=9823 RepID=A0A8D0INV1_PIG